MTDVLVSVAIVAYTLVAIGYGLRRKAEVPGIPNLFCAFAGMIWPAMAFLRLGAWLASPPR